MAGLQPQAQPFDDAGDFLISSDFADFTLNLSDIEWRLHRIILSTRSGFLRRACAGSFKETTDQKVTLHDSDPHMLARAIVFMYTGAYPVPSTPDLSRAAFRKLIMGIRTPENEVSDLECHGHCYALGDKYDIPALKSYASIRFSPELHECTIKQLIQSITSLYTTALTPDDGIRKLIVYRVQRMWPINQQPDFQDLLKTIPDFAVDFGTRYHRAKLLVWCTTCRRHILLPQTYYNCNCGYSGICQIGPVCGDDELLDMYRRCERCEISRQEQHLVPFSKSDLIFDGHSRSVKAIWKV